MVFLGLNKYMLWGHVHHGRLPACLINWRMPPRRGLTGPGTSDKTATRISLLRNAKIPPPDDPAAAWAPQLDLIFVRQLMAIFITIGKSLVEALCVGGVISLLISRLAFGRRDRSRSWVRNGHLLRHWRHGYLFGRRRPGHRPCGHRRNGHRQCSLRASHPSSA